MRAGTALHARMQPVHIYANQSINCHNLCTLGRQAGQCRPGWVPLCHQTQPGYQCPACMHACMRTKDGHMVPRVSR